MDRVYTIPCTPFTLYLSSYDKTWVAMHSKRIFCFSLPDDADPETLIGELHTALKRTVHELPWLAGSVVPLSTLQEGAPPWNWTIIPEGDCQLVVKDLSQTLDYAVLRDSHFSQSLLDGDTLCPLPQAAYFQQDPVPVCRVQANLVRGGLLLVVSIAHTACDGQGITEVIGRLVYHTRHAGSPTPSPVAAPEYLADRRTVLSGHGPGDIAQHPAWTAYPGGRPPVPMDGATCRTFRISPANVAALKDAALADAAALAPADAPAPWLSSHDAISALFYTRVALARHRAGIASNDAPMRLVASVDCRARLGLPAPYHGNAIAPVAAVLPLVALGNPHALGRVALALRAQIAGVRGADLRDVLAFVEREGGGVQLAFAQLGPHTLFLTSHWRFDMHALDFGPRLGRIGALRLPVTGMLPGLHVVLPRLPDGGCEVMVSEAERTMAELAKDPVWTRFTTLME
jgi:hypothetical protein